MPARSLFLRAAIISGLYFGSAACGARSSPIFTPPPPVELTPPSQGLEVCNGIDDDLDGEVDEDYRNSEGFYLSNEHCGRCGNACEGSVPQAGSVACELRNAQPTCVATDCGAGYAFTDSGGCALETQSLCLSCLDDNGCGTLSRRVCAEIGGQKHCTLRCDGDICPEGYTCNPDKICLPLGGDCQCDEGESYTVACRLATPSGSACQGTSTCNNGNASACLNAAEVCDEVDNDCDGVVDNGYVDARGNYSIKSEHCGQCSRDCTAIGTDLTCGGDPFAPRCVQSCPDSADGLQVGDHLDADTLIATGCECRIASLTDEPGPVGASDSALDANCDGADGEVLNSYYVASDGTDAGPGSPSRPLRSLQEAVRRARASIESTALTKRADIFVAEGVYTEAFELHDGVRVHGGYRRDFRVQDSARYSTEIRAPLASTYIGGAVMYADNVGRTVTVLENLILRGLDAATVGGVAVGVVFRDPKSELRMMHVQVISGKGGEGTVGGRGSTGQAPTSEAGVGAAPTAAVETGFSQVCDISQSSNVTQGGQGGRNTCAAVNGNISVSGGTGGSGRCPAFDQAVPAGSPGSGMDPGAAGLGGVSGRGPIFRGTSCRQSVCCGPADIQIGPNYRQAQSGRSGADGSAGDNGLGCQDALGTFESEQWRAGSASSGGAGQPGSGGGGGGAGGGVEVDYITGSCAYADGIGGGGGGGGAGGCGGGAGQAGTSGGHSIAVLVQYSALPDSFPSFGHNQFLPGAGGRGGDGGDGGDGAFGGTGAPGLTLAASQLGTITFSGAFPGGRGGKGGTGGRGGTGGGGCGGGSIGIWITGAANPTAVTAWRSQNTFTLQSGGAPGVGAGGAAQAGISAGSIDVIAR